MNAYWHKDSICTINTYGRVGQSVTYQSADTCLSADPGVASSIRPGPSEIDLFTISKAHESFHQGLRCLVDANLTFYLGGSTIGADEAINDRDVQTGLS